jgi:hypothetical protein
MIFGHQTIDVTIGGYLSKDAARDDYQAVLACGSYLHGTVLISRDLKGDLSVEQTDHMVREGAEGFGTAGLVLGLLVPPLVLATTAIGATAGAIAGETTAPPDNQQDRGTGRSNHPDRRGGPDRPSTPLAGRHDQARHHPSHPEGHRRGRRPPRSGT